ncbi:MAG: ribonuclease HI [Prevotella sp.]|nr:ribonuclease HI [Prevotella sp.]
MRVRIFTDGACSENPGPGGWAAAFNTSDKCYTISGCEESTTNNRMELMAVIKSLDKIVKLECGRENHNEYEIYSDSAYVVNTINNHWIEKWRANDWKTTKHEDVKNRDLWEKFSTLKRELTYIGVNVALIKIKGHAGNTFNELVDKLAKEESMKAKEILRQV